MFSRVNFSFKVWYKIIFQLSKSSVQMFYSHFNALIFIVVLKSFKDWIFTIAKSMLKRCLFKHCCNFKTLRHGWLFLIALKRAFTGTFLTIVILTSMLAIGSSFFSHSQIFEAKTNFNLVMERQRTSRSRRVTNHLDHDWWFSDQSDIRFLCGENHAKLNFHYQRCFFVVAHQQKGMLDLTFFNHLIVLPRCLKNKF